MPPPPAPPNLCAKEEFILGLLGLKPQRIHLLARRENARNSGELLGAVSSGVLGSADNFPFRVVWEWPLLTTPY